MSKTLSLHHVVFCTKHRQSTIDPAHAEELYRVIWAMVTDRRCYLLRINSMPDHVHILVDLHPTVALATLVSELKAKSSQWMKKSGIFPLFEGWAADYFAESVSADAKDAVIQYIKGQQQHHGLEPYLDEMQRLYRKNGLPWHDRDLM